MVMIDLTSDVQSSSYEEIIYGLSRNSSNALPPPISLIALNGYRRMILTDSNLEMVANKIESNTLVGAGGTSSLLQTTNEYGGSINFSNVLQLARVCITCSYEQGRNCIVSDRVNR